MKHKLRSLLISIGVALCACIVAYAATATVHTPQPVAESAPQEDIDTDLEPETEPLPVLTRQADATKTGPKAKRKQLPAVSPIISPDEATDVSILVDKSERTMYLYNGDEIIAEYSVGIGKKQGKKQKEGDYKTPEGTYYICVKNAQSQFYRSLGLSYPNSEDAQRGYEEGLIEAADRDRIVEANEKGKIPDWYTELGGCIMIHGQSKKLAGQCDWSAGCVTVSNKVMDVIWDYCSKGVTVTIQK